MQQIMDNFLSKYAQPQLELIEFRLDSEKPGAAYSLGTSVSDPFIQIFCF